MPGWTPTTAAAGPHPGEDIGIAHGVAGANPARPQVLVSERTTTRPIMSPPIMDSGFLGHRVHERLVDTTTRPGRRSERMAVRVQHRRGIRRVTDHDQIGVLRGTDWGRAEAVLRAGGTRSGRCPAAISAASGSVNWGWMTTGCRGCRPCASNVKASAPPASAPPGSPAGPWADASPRSPRRAGGGGELGGGLVDDLDQAVRRSRQPYVDGKVQQTLAEILVTMVRQVRLNAVHGRRAATRLRYPRSGAAAQPMPRRRGPGGPGSVGVYGVGEALRH